VHVVARVGAALRGIWKCAGRTVETESAYLEASRGRRLDFDALRSQLERLGGTPYQLGELTIDMLGDPFLPASMLNQMRRDAVAQLQALESEAPVVEVLDPEAALAFPKPAREITEHKSPQLHLLVRASHQLDAALTLIPASITLDYLDLYGLRPSVERVRKAGITVRVASPRIFKPGEAKIMDFLVSLGCPILVRSTGLLHAMQSIEHPELIGDFSLNTANSPAAEIYFDLGITRLTPGHDLNAEQVADLATVEGGGAAGGYCLPTSSGVSHGALRVLPVSFYWDQLQGLRTALRKTSGCATRRRGAATSGHG